MVTMTAPTGTLSLNTSAWSNAACPMLASVTRTTRSGASLTASAACCISSNSAASCLCRPLVSTTIRSWRFESRNVSTRAVHGDLDGVRLRVGAVERDPGLGRVLLELVERAGAEHVGADQRGAEPLEARTAAACPGPACGRARRSRPP
jgi:hypothetical protein